MAKKKNKKAKRTSSSTGTIAAVIAGGLGLVGLVAFARRSRGLGATEGGSSAADLALDQPHHGPGDRANMDFRPDPTAPVPKDRRDALAPATLPNPNNVEPAM
ncbi:hypothetical protein SCH01S_51_00880 [Sphingomonas changbaiensis NBRC 104936]|uniref:Uncharacterized protein n=1 Tax=Sphingomonas changbaiensis NBRC 104936 TaxID=1219043 RepID=A0A0E9MTJ1_9SPHN|nr:hypothetical protein [Sphingomonas changbaiensis]GAO40756.1 hypothetical protein SCH01S_51_00880 [Sphingomonas changbaiensis NBRC 104936]